MKPLQKTEPALKPTLGMESLKGQNLAELELYNAKACCGPNGNGTTVLTEGFALVLEPII